VNSEKAHYGLFERFARSLAHFVTPPRIPHEHFPRIEDELVRNGPKIFCPLLSLLRIFQTVLHLRSVLRRLPVQVALFVARRVQPPELPPHDLRAPGVVAAVVDVYRPPLPGLLTEEEVLSLLLSNTLKKIG